MAKSSIEWTENTWNPLTGCDPISAGCAHCYARNMSRRLQAMQVPKYTNGFSLTLHPECLEEPLHWTKPVRVFVNSMSDLFHKDVPAEFVHRVFDVMLRANWHQFQLLTKRADRLAYLGPELPWAENIWAGVTVENSRYTHRIDHLRSTGARVKFLSLEPLLGPLPGLDLSGIHQVIVGGESGAGARPMDPEWVRDIRNQCASAGVPFFFKQWGGRNKKAAGSELDGREYKEVPVLARIAAR